MTTAPAVANPDAEIEALTQDVAGLVEKMYNTWPALPGHLFSSPGELNDTEVKDTPFEPIATAMREHGVTAELGTIGVVIDRLRILELHPYRGWTQEHARNQIALALASKRHGQYIDNFRIAEELMGLLRP